MTLFGFFFLCFVAFVCGAIGSAIAGRDRGGCIATIALGFIGALLGHFLARELRLPEIFSVTVSGERFPVVWSIIGSSLFVAILSLFSRGRR